MDERLILLLTIVVIIATVIVAIARFLRVRATKRQRLQLEEHKNALRTRIQEQDTQLKFVSMDVSLFLEHKTALRKRIQALEWFETFTDIFFSRQSNRVVFEPDVKWKGVDRRFRYSELLEWADFQPVVLLGDAGSGKTTCLNRLAVRVSEQPLGIPFLLNLASYYPSRDLIPMMNTERKLDRGSIETALRNGDATVFVDAINETPYQEDAINAIDTLVAEYCKNRYLVATRTSNFPAISSKLSTFLPFEIQPLSISSVKDFLIKFLESEEDALDLMSKLDERLLGLGSNPYMLEMIATLYRDTGEIPRNRAELYNRFLYRLLYHWDLKIHHSVFHTYMEDVLATVGYGVDQHATAHQITEVQSIISSEIAHLNARHAQNYTSQDVWEDLKKLAIMRLDSRTSTLMFLHHSIQEYYSGLSMQRRLSRDDLKIQAISEFAKDPAWREPILFLAGLLENVTELVYALIDSGSFFLAAKCIENAKWVEPRAVDEAAIAALTEFKYGDVDETNAVVSYESILALRKVHTRCSPSLEPRILDDLDYFVQKYAPVDAFRIHFSTEQFSTEELGSLIQDETDPLTVDYISTLGTRDSNEALAILDNYISASQSRFRPEAIRSIGRIGNRTTAEMLAKLLWDGDINLKVPIFNALIQIHRRIGIDHDSITQTLIRYLTDQRMPYRDSAAWALKSIAGNKEKGVFIEQALTEDNRRVQGMLVYIIGELGLSEAVPKLLALASGEGSSIPDAYVREDLAVVLGTRLKSAEAEPLLLDLLHDEDSVVRMQAIKGLGNIGDKTVIQALKNSLGDEWRHVSIAARYAIDDLNRRQQLLSNIASKEVTMNETLDALIKLNSRAIALQNRIDETREKERKGFLDTGRADALLTTYETERLGLLVEVEAVLANTPLAPLNPVVERVKTGESDEQVKRKLVETAQENGWGDVIREKLEEHKGTIISLIIAAGIEIGRQLASGS